MAVVAKLMIGPQSVMAFGASQRGSCSTSHSPKNCNAGSTRDEPSVLYLCSLVHVSCDSDNPYGMGTVFAKRHKKTSLYFYEVLR